MSKQKDYVIERFSYCLGTDDAICSICKILLLKKNMRIIGYKYNINLIKVKF